MLFLELPQWGLWPGWMAPEEMYWYLDLGPGASLSGPLILMLFYCPQFWHQGGLLSAGVRPG